MKNKQNSFDTTKYFKMNPKDSNEKLEKRQLKKWNHFEIIYEAIW